MSGRREASGHVERSTQSRLDVGLLILRVAPALLLWRFHVTRKLRDFDAELGHFPDPLGIGHPASFLLALAAEGVFTVLVAVGLAGRLSALPVLFTMGVVVVFAGRGIDDADTQTAMLYALPYAVIAVSGPGRFAVDGLLARRYDGWIERFLPRRARRS